MAALALFKNWRQQKLTEPATGLLFSILIGYLIWLAEFGYQRYLAPIDILCGAGLLVLIMQIPWQLERGVALTRQCQGALKAAQQKVEILLSQGVSAEPEPFAESVEPALASAE